MLVAEWPSPSGRAKAAALRCWPRWAGSQLGRHPTHILHELPADWPDLLAQGGAEHHTLLLMGRQTKDLLYIPAHVWMGCQQRASLSILSDRADPHQRGTSPSQPGPDNTGTIAAVEWAQGCPRCLRGWARMGGSAGMGGAAVHLLAASMERPCQCALSHASGKGA